MCRMLDQTTPRKQTMVGTMGKITPDHISFMVDHMLTKLGKYLRIIGSDAEWHCPCRTQELILRATDEGRVFLTRNRRIPTEYPPPDRLMTIDATDPVEQLHEVVRAFQLDPRCLLFSRCIRCNVALLEVVNKDYVRERVHPNVIKHYDRLYTCPQCHTVFWKGSHVRNTCRKLRLPLTC